MRIVTNSSPLIAFAILGRLEWLPLLFSEVCIPPQVLAEISCWSKPYSQMLKTFAKDKVKPIQNQIAVNLLTKDIDLGEAAAIVLALENGIEDLLIDDFKGRKLAQLNGLHPMGTVTAIKLSRVGVQTFRFGRDWLR